MSGCGHMDIYIFLWFMCDKMEVVHRCLCSHSLVCRQAVKVEIMCRNTSNLCFYLCSGLMRCLICWGSAIIGQSVWLTVATCFRGNPFHHFFAHLTHPYSFIVSFSCFFFYILSVIAPFILTLLLSLFHFSVFFSFLYSCLLSFHHLRLFLCSLPICMSVFWLCGRHPVKTCCVYTDVCIVVPLLSALTVVVFSVCCVCLNYLDYWDVYGSTLVIAPSPLVLSSCLCLHSSVCLCVLSVQNSVFYACLCIFVFSMHVFASLSYVKIFAYQHIFFCILASHWLKEILVFFLFQEE